MFIFDPIAMLIVVAGVFAYFAFKGGGSAKDVLPTKTTDGQDFGEWYRNLCETNRWRNEQRLDEVNYQKWLATHRQ